MQLVLFILPVKNLGAAEVEMNAFLRAQRVLAVKKEYVPDGSIEQSGRAVFSGTAGKGIAAKTHKSRKNQNRPTPFPLAPSVPLRGPSPLGPMRPPRTERDDRYARHQGVVRPVAPDGLRRSCRVRNSYVRMGPQSHRPARWFCSGPFLCAWFFATN